MEPHTIAGLESLCKQLEGVRDEARAELAAYRDDVREYAIDRHGDSGSNPWLECGLCGGSWDVGNAERHGEECPAKPQPAVARETTSVWVDEEGVPRPDVRIDGMVSLWKAESPSPEDVEGLITVLRNAKYAADHTDASWEGEDRCIVYLRDQCGIPYDPPVACGGCNWTGRNSQLLPSSEAATPHIKCPECGKNDTRYLGKIPERLAEENRKTDVWWETLDEHDQELFVTEFIDTLCDLLLDPGEGRTREELRDSMETYLDAQYDADVRHVAPLPRQAQLNKIIDVLLAKEGTDPVIYVRDGLICQHINEVEEQAIKKALLEELK